MRTDPQLHHAAFRIAPQSLEKVVEVYGLLGCVVSYRKEGARWAMIGQASLPHFDIQLVEVDAEPRRDAARISSHIAFISENPAEHVARIEEWAHTHGLRFEKGGWSERELWFDLPDLFIDFVVEVMHVSVTEE